MTDTNITFTRMELGDALEAIHEGKKSWREETPMRRKLDATYKRLFKLYKEAQS